MTYRHNDLTISQSESDESGLCVIPRLSDRMRRPGVRLLRRTGRLVGKRLTNPLGIRA
jgi:hypothetical protein